MSPVSVNSQGPLAPSKFTSLPWARSLIPSAALSTLTPPPCEIFRTWSLIAVPVASPFAGREWGARAACACGALAGGGFEGVAVEDVGPALVGDRVARRRRGDGVGAAGPVGGQRAEPLLVHRVGLGDLAARVAGLVEL